MWIICFLLYFPPHKIFKRVNSHTPCLDCSKTSNKRVSTNTLSRKVSNVFVRKSVSAYGQLIIFADSINT